MQHRDLISITQMLYIEPSDVKLEIFACGLQDSEEFVDYKESYSFSHTRLKVFGFLI